MTLEPHRQALETFVKGIITRPRSLRYLTLIRQEKRWDEIIEYLYHDFEQYIRDNVVVRKSDFDCWHYPAFSYNVNQDNKLGAPKESIRLAFEEEESWGGWLIISQDGKAGIFLPEEPSNEIFLRI